MQDNFVVLEEGHMVSNPSQVDVESENQCAKFLMRFTVEEQTTLMDLDRTTGGGKTP
jgi:hypothetical protein